MIKKSKIIRAIFIVLSLFTVPSYVFAQTFSGVCSGNGGFTENVRITSVMIMGAENNRKLYIATNNHKDWIATKSYESNNPSDRVLIDAVVKANILNNYVDLCITGKGKELYGINLKYN